MRCALLSDRGHRMLIGACNTDVVSNLASGLCISTFSGEFAEITGVDINELGDQLIFATKSSTNVLMDMRMKRVLKRFRGHQNSTRHFVDVSFGPAPGLLVGGSEDGRVCMWNMATGELDRTLDGHQGPVYSTAWSPTRSMLASCSEDGSIRLWNKGVVA